MISESFLKGVICPLIIIAGTTSCHQPETLTNDEKEKIIQEITSTLNNYYADIKKSGLTAEFNYLDSSSNFFWVPPGYSTALTYDTIAAIIKRNAVLYRAVDNSFEALTIMPLEHELATYTGRLRSVVTDTSGHTNSFTLVETGIIKKDSNRWKLLCGQTHLIQSDNK